MSTMPKAYPREFRDDRVAVAQLREAGVTIKEIAEDCGIFEGCLQNWLRQTAFEAGKRRGTRQRSPLSCVNCANVTGS